MSGYGDQDAASIKKRQVFESIKAAFSLFDRDNKGMCDVREIGTIVRHLGICPTEIELRDLITECEEEEPTGFIRFERFERMMSRILMENQAPLPRARRAARRLRRAGRRCLRASPAAPRAVGPRAWPKAARGRCAQYPRDSEEKLLRAFRVRALLA